MANLIWRGKGEKTTRNHPIAVAALPGVAVDIDYANKKLVLATANSKSPLILGNLLFTGQTVETPYNEGDTAAAFEVAKNDEFQVRAGGAIAVGDYLAVGANGKFVKSTTVSFAVAESAGAADELVDVKIVNPAL